MSDIIYAPKGLNWVSIDKPLSVVHVQSRGSDYTVCGRTIKGMIYTNFTSDKKVCKTCEKQIREILH